MKETNTTIVFNLAKSGINAFGVNFTCNGPPLTTYQIASASKQIDGSKMPKLKPHFAIRAVYLVPPNCEKTNNQKIIKTPKNLTVGLASRAGQLITPEMSI